MQQSHNISGVFRLLRKHSDLRNHNCSLFSPTLPNPLVYLNKTEVWAIAAWPSVKSALSRYQISLPCSMPVMIAINSQCVGLRLSDSFLYYLKSIKKSGTAEPLSSYRLSPKLVDLVIPMQPADQEAAVNGTAKYPNNEKPGPTTTTRLKTDIHRVKLRHRIYGHDAIAILWV